MDRSERGWLTGSPHPLVDDHDVALLDLDGVVYVGPNAVPGAAEALAQARARGLRLAFVTNNAARPPSVVADHLTDLGIEARPSEIVTSAQAAARYLADRLPGGARVLVVGTTGLIDALRERGLKPVESADGPVDAVVQGYSPDLSWKQLAEGAVAINRGVPWVATNVDATVPSPRGPLPGNGSLVAALRHATRREPVTTGKPDPTMHREMVLRSGAQHPIVVGDRLDTDIEGATAVGCPSLLVFTGVTTVIDLLHAPTALRPTYLAADLSGLLRAHPEPTVDGGVTRCGRWTARDRGAGLVLALANGPGAQAAERDGDRNEDTGDDGGWDDDTLDAVRALCVAHWSRVDAAGDAGGSDPTAASDAAVTAADESANDQAESNATADVAAVADATAPTLAVAVGAAEGDIAAQKVLARLGLLAAAAP